MYKGLPWGRLIGMDAVKRALLIAVVNRKAGPLLITGPRGTGKSVAMYSVAPFVAPHRLLTLPVSVTEERLFGGTDVEATMQEGRRVWEPGLLAQSDGNILVADDVQRWRPALLMSLLDAVDQEYCQVERDGLSQGYEVKTTLLATMNPEEGSLPGPMLQRFGMVVTTDTCHDVEERTALLTQLMATEETMAMLSDMAELVAQVKAAREGLSQVEVSAAMQLLAARYAATAFAEGHRGELYLIEAARAIAALAGRTYVLPGDVEEASQYTLPHRLREMPPNTQSMSDEEDTQAEEDSSQQEEQADQETTQEELEPPDASEDDKEEAAPENQEDGSESPEQEKESREEDNQRDSSTEEQPPEDQEQASSAPDDDVAPVLTMSIPPLHLDDTRSRKKAKGSGKRSVTRTDEKQGRYIAAKLPSGKVSDIALDATIRQAAIWQQSRPKGNCAMTIYSEDIRQKVREKRTGNTFIFVVDASGSMRAKQRMAAVKGTIETLLRDAYEHRDHVALIAFRRAQAEIVLPPTHSVTLAHRRLASLPTGGKTPLADGLGTAWKVCERLLRQDAGCDPVLVLVTDGRANVSQPGEDPVKSALDVAKGIQQAGIRAIVIDTEADFIKVGIAPDIAKALGATYYTMDRLSEESMLRILGQAQR